MSARDATTAPSTVAATLAGGATASAAPHAVPARVRWGVALGTRLLAALARTWRVREVGREPWHALRREGRPVIVALWHGEMLALLPNHRDEGVAVLVSEHRDGEIIARVLHHFGFRTVRGSTSRGGGRALLELVATLRRGHEIAITPDGPRGPRHDFAPGAAVAAQRSGAPIIGLSAHVDRAWQLGSWDRFLIPKPFARITIAYGEPQWVTCASAREAAAEAPRLGRYMRSVREASARAAGAPHQP